MAGSNLTPVAANPRSDWAAIAAARAEERRQRADAARALEEMDEFEARISYHEAARAQEAWVGFVSPDKFRTRGGGGGGSFGRGEDGPAPASAVVAAAAADAAQLHPQIGITTNVGTTSILALDVEVEGADSLRSAGAFSSLSSTA